MCFQSWKRDYVKEGEGWKIYRIEDDVLYSTKFVPHNERNIPRTTNKWCKAKQYLEQSEGEYRTRWSFFESKKDAEEVLKFLYEDCPSLKSSYTIRKILFKDSNYKGIVCWSRYFTCIEIPNRQALWIKILN